MAISDVQVRILEVIFAFQDESSAALVADDQIAEELDLDVKDVQMHLDLLEEEGFVNLARAFGPSYSAAVTSRGRMILQDPTYFQQGQAGQGDVINMSGDFRGTILNIKSTLTDVSQSVGTIPHAGAAAKEELQRLIQQLEETLEQTPPERAEEAEAVAQSAEILVQTATQEKPNKPMVQITGEGLKQAAKNVADVMPTVLTIASQIVDTVQKLVS